MSPTTARRADREEGSTFDPRELLLELSQGLSEGYKVSGDVNLPSFFGKAPIGDLGDKCLTSTATAIWLAQNAPVLFRTIWEKYLDEPQVEPPSPATLTTKLMETMQGELRYLSNPAQTELLARLMVALAGGRDSKPIDWDKELRGLARSQAASPSGLGIERPLVDWVVDVELDRPELSAKKRARSLKRLLRKHPKKLEYWDLNSWAYLLLNLDLIKAGSALAKAALERKEWSGTLDTFGWAMFLEGNYEDAEASLQSAETLAETGSAVWCEIQCHRVYVGFWQGDMDRARAIVKELKTAAPDDPWTAKAEAFLLPLDTVPSGSGDRETREYDVALSFADEDRKHAEKLACFLSEHGRTVFYDDYLRAELWGENLYEYLVDVYQERARFCVIFVSRHYARKNWTRLECQAAQARALTENRPYILPVRLDGSKLPGLPPTVAYVDLDRSSIPEIGRLLLAKLGSELQ